MIFLKFTPDIAMELHSLNNMNKRYIDNSSHKKLLDSVTGINGWIIGYLAHNSDYDVYQRDLEDTFGITRSTVSKVVNLMVQKGLVERLPVEHDARLKKLILTDKSRELISYMNDDNKNLENILTQGFSDDEKTQMSQYIERMKNNIKTALDEASVDDLAMPCIKKKGRMIK